MPPPLTITIQAFSDTFCPWCYIGKKDLDRAMELYAGQHPNVQFEVIWNPFYLEPRAKVSAYEKKDYFLAKLGPAAAPAFFARVEDEAAAHGLTVNWEGRCGNTRDSHILLLLASRQQQRQRGPPQSPSPPPPPPRTSLQGLLADALFRGALEQGRDISDRSFLVETAVRVGLAVDEGGEAGAGEGSLRKSKKKDDDEEEDDEDEEDEGDEEGDGEGEGEEEERKDALLGWLDSGAARAEADALDAYAKREVGITAVPSYVVQGRYRVGGKQGPDVFLRLFERVRLARQDGGGGGGGGGG